MNTLAKWFILWAIRRAKRLEAESKAANRWRRRVYRVVSFDDKRQFTRFEPFWHDEWPDVWWLNPDGTPKFGPEKHPIHDRPHRPPWWRPFNLLLHRWNPEGGSTEGMHDHPRWTITICLRGQITEVTPWERKLLKPGSVVFRSRKAIHDFEIEPRFAGKTWTLFIVGRRNHRQNTFVVTPR